MLLQIKASLNHGEWLPWLNGEIEIGRLAVKVREAQNYMRLATNTQRVAYLEESTSIRAMCKPAYDERTVAITVCCSTELESAPIPLFARSIRARSAFLRFAFRREC